MLFFLFKPNFVFFKKFRIIITPLINGFEQNLNVEFNLPKEYENQRDLIRILET